MKTIDPRDWYRKKITSLYQERRAIRQTYSLRAFARDCKISASLLSEIIQGHHPLTARTADKIADRFISNPQDRELFRAAAIASGGQNEVFERLLSDAQIEVLDSAAFDPISKWYQLPILELFKIPGLRVNEKSVAAAFDISVADAKSALDALVKAKQLHRSARKYQINTQSTRVRSETTSTVIRKFHAEMIHKSLHSIHEQGVEERDLGSAMLAFDSSQIEEAKGAIDEFRKQFQQRFGTKNANSVYALNTQFFRLTRKETKNEKH